MRKTLAILLAVAGLARAGEYTYVIPMPEGQGVPPAYYDPDYPKLPVKPAPRVARQETLGERVLRDANENLRREMEPTEAPNPSPSPRQSAGPSAQPCSEPASRRCL